MFNQETSRWSLNTQTGKLRLQDKGEKNGLPKLCVLRDYAGGPVVNTLCLYCRGHGFQTWSRN